MVKSNQLVVDHAGISNTADSSLVCPTSSSYSVTSQGGESDRHPAIAQVHRSRISDEITCAVCLDILARPVTLVPCGHTFCHPCWSDAKRTDCPECRLAVKCYVPARQIENVIATLASVPNLLDEGDKQHYFERTLLSQQASMVRLDRRSEVMAFPTVKYSTHSSRVSIITCILAIGVKKSKK
jgi:hypothetical protein